MQNIPVRGRLEGRQPSFVPCLQFTTWAFAGSLCLKRRYLVCNRSPNYPEREYFAHSGEKNDNMTPRRESGKKLSRIIDVWPTMELFGSRVVQPAPTLKLRPEGEQGLHIKLGRVRWLTKNREKSRVYLKNLGAFQKGIAREATQEAGQIEATLRKDGKGLLAEWIGTNLRPLFQKALPPWNIRGKHGSCRQKEWCGISIASGGSSCRRDRFANMQVKHAIEADSPETPPKRSGGRRGRAIARRQSALRAPAEQGGALDGERERRNREKPQRQHGR